MLFRTLTIAVLLSLPTAAGAQDLDQLLNKGQVVLVETNDAGKFKQATAIVHIARPPEEVWAVIRDLGKLKEYMPKVVKSDARKLGPNRMEVDLEIEVPGVNTAYTYRYELDPKRRLIKGRWVAGDLKGSLCQWKLTPYQGGTLVEYTVATKNFSGIAQSLDDDQQTITVGVNVGAALAATRGVKKRVESLAATARGGQD